MLAKNKNKYLSFCDTEAMVAESVAYLRRHEPEEGYYVGFSGGKDSIVVLDLCRRSGVQHQAYYSCTRIDPPEVVRFIRQYYQDVIWLYPNMTFYNAIRKKSPPLRTVRWCCDTLKKEPGKEVGLRHRVMGIRAEESVRRAGRPRTDRIKKYGQTIYKPIFAWSEYHIWDYIDSHQLPYPSLYDEGFSRIGCVVCPFMMGKSPGMIHRRAESMRRWPGIWQAFEKAARDWFESLPDDPQHRKDPTFQEYWVKYLKGFEA